MLEWGVPSVCVFVCTCARTRAGGHGLYEKREAAILWRLPPKDPIRRMGDMICAKKLITALFK